MFAPEQLVVAPDGPLRTRSWDEVQASVSLSGCSARIPCPYIYITNTLTQHNDINVQEALSHMCEAAKMLRAELEESRCVLT